MNEHEVEKVVGGAFNFYTKNGQEKCYVDNLGTFFCTEGAFEWVVNRTADMTTPSTVVVEEALALGFFWK